MHGPSLSYLSQTAERRTKGNSIVALPQLCLGGGQLIYITNKNMQQICLRWGWVIIEMKYHCKIDFYSTLHYRTFNNKNKAMISRK